MSPAQEEPDWDACYQSGDMPWDGGIPHPELEAWLQDHELPGPVLVPGCGRGHDVRLIAARGGDVTGLDLSPAALERARRFPSVGREHYVEANLFELPSALHRSFARVWEHTSFCAIPPAKREAWVRAMHAVLQPGGELFGVFFIDPDPSSEGPPWKISLEPLRGILQPPFRIIEEWAPTRAYPGREGAEWMMRLEKA